MEYIDALSPGILAGVIPHPFGGVYHKRSRMDSGQALMRNPSLYF